MVGRGISLNAFMTDRSPTVGTVVRHSEVSLVRSDRSESPSLHLANLSEDGERFEMSCDELALRPAEVW